MKEVFLRYKLESMTLQEKIGQMMIIAHKDTLEMNKELEQILTKYKPGGFILFKSNILNFEQTKKLIDDIKSISDNKIMIAVDQEGGVVQRLDGNVGFEKYPPMYEIGKTLNENSAFEVGKKMGKELKFIGADMNMAPVLDIFSNPNNKIIANRAFGSNATIVNKMAFAYSDGLLNEKIIAVGKHFPGHGDTIEDSHVDLPIIYKNLEELMRMELIPFLEAVKKKLPALMVAHIATPEITFYNTPASLSKIMINDLLIKKWDMTA